MIGHCSEPGKVNREVKPDVWLDWSHLNKRGRCTISHRAKVGLNIALQFRDFYLICFWYVVIVTCYSYLYKMLEKWIDGLNFRDELEDVGEELSLNGYCEDVQRTPPQPTASVEPPSGQRSCFQTRDHIDYLFIIFAF